MTNTEKLKGTIAVTGATGHLGQLIVEELIARGVEAGRIVAFVRDLNKASGVADRGVAIRNAD